MSQNPDALRELVSRPIPGDALNFEQELLSATIATTASNAAQNTTETTTALTPENDPILDPNHKLTRDEAKGLADAEKDYRDALAYVKDVIAPPMMRVDSDVLQIGDVFVRTFYTYAYPDYLEGNWLSPIINWDVKFDMSIFVYPIDSAYIMRYLKKRLTELYSARSINADKGLLSDPALDAQVQDVEELRASLTRGQERYFHFSVYVTFYAESRENLKKLTNTFDTMLAGRNILAKPSFLRAEQGFVSTGPFARDEVVVYRNISTRGLSTTFPFTSSSLSQEDGVLYGINTHNNSLIIFDRFRTENANMVVFAKSG